MKTARGAECNGNHDRNGKTGMGRYDVYSIEGRRYTVCAHKVGDHGYCGALIDVTDLPQVVICCGDDTNHQQDTIVATY